MISLVIFLVWITIVIIPILSSSDLDEHWLWLIWLALSLLWVIPIFTGINIKDNEGQYKGYVTAVEQNGAIFKGWNVYLKTELESSNEGKACIDRDNPELIKKLKEVQESKENVTLLYEGVWQYAIGVCPDASWMIKGIK